MLYKRLTSSAALADKLATYGGLPAIHYQQPPPADDENWGDAQYPRIDYIVDMQENPARNASGVLAVSVWCDSDKGAAPEEIEPILRELLHSAFVQTDEYPFCFAWVRSEAFEVKNQEMQTARTIGMTVIFDVMACPCQYTMYPDPIKAMNQWTKTVLPNAVVLGEDKIDGWLLPTKEKPVVYWRLAAQGIQEQHYAYVWLNVSLEGHVYARTAADRLYNLVCINTKAALAGHIPMEDGSPLFFQNYSCRPQLDYLSQGQIQAGGRFGLLKGDKPSFMLNNANIREKE